MSIIPRSVFICQLKTSFGPFFGDLTLCNHWEIQKNTRERIYDPYIRSHHLYIEIFKTHGCDNHRPQPTKKEYFMGGSFKTFTITKPYFDLIYQGDKKTEYRESTDYWRKNLVPSPDIIFFHYRKNIYIKVHIGKIRHIKRPKKLFMSDFIKTEKCFAIGIKKVSLLDKKGYERAKKNLQK